jgi:hypothetical protein
MDGLDAVAFIALAAIFGTIAGFVVQIVKAVFFRQRRASALVTVRNKEGETVAVDLDPGDEASVRRFFDVVETLKRDDPRPTRFSEAEARSPTPTIG